MSLEKAIKSLEKTYGEGTIISKDNNVFKNLEVISTGIMAVDNALGCGGLPRGRIVEIYGPESSGKTTLATLLVASAQKAGLKCAYIDAEYALDPDYMKTLGVAFDDIILSQPQSGEEAITIASELVMSGEIGLIIVDSVAALCPIAEVEGEMVDANMGLHARLMAKAMRKLVPIVSRTNTLVVFINQLRMKIGVMYGNPETTTGGKALPYAASIRMDIRRIEPIKDKDVVIGAKTRVKIPKNKLSSPYKQCEFSLIYGKGVDPDNDIKETALNNGTLVLKGSWVYFGEERLCQGKDGIIPLFTDRPELRENIIKELRRIK